MKKKVFSKLLMVALVATVGAFTSCKDYDDDINDLRSQINGLNTSLSATVDKKVAEVSSSVTALEQKLADVKSELEKVDLALQNELNTAKETGKANASAIETLKSQVAQLETAKQQLESGIADLKSGLESANASIKENAKSIVNLLKADKDLEAAISKAQAAADNALSEANKAKEKAQENATAIAGLDANFANLEKTVAKNLEDVTKTINQVKDDLDARIKTNTTNIATLRSDVDKNGKALEAVETKLSSLEQADKDILAALADAQKKLEQADKDNLAALADAQSKLEQADKDAAAAQSKINDQLIEKIKTNLDAINALKSETALALQEMVQKTIPETVACEVEDQLAEALPEALKEYMKTTDIKALVKTEEDARKSAIELLTDKVKSDSDYLKKYIDGEFLIAVKALISDSVAKTAGELKTAYETADRALQGQINDINDKTKAGSLANALEALKGDVADMKDADKPGSLAQQIAAVESFFAPAEGSTDLSIQNLVDKIGSDQSALNALVEDVAATTKFQQAMTDAANEANNEILGMITSINLFANQHMAQADSYGKAAYTNGDQYKYTYGYDNFDHELKFVFTVEQGIYEAPNYFNDKQEGLEFAEWNFPGKYIRDDIDNTKGYKVKGQTEGDADGFDFRDGRYRSYEDSILVRVSPTNANLKKAEIALINSKGENIVGADKLVQLVGVEKYTREGYITRAEGESGLWVIKFKLNDENVGEQWLKYSVWNRQPIVYAVAVKNTGIKVEADEDGNETMTSEGVERYVASEFDLSLETEAASHAWNFEVNNVLVSKIHNRYIETEEGLAGNSAYWTDDKAGHKPSFRYELTWNYNPCDAPEYESEPGQGISEETEQPWRYIYGCGCRFTPSGEEIEDCEPDDSEYGVGYTGYTYTRFFLEKDGYEDPALECDNDRNATDRVGHIFHPNSGVRESSGVDNRHLKDFLNIDFDYEMDGAMWAKIDIEFPASVCGVATPIKGFFVTLDQQFALESENSEINAWVSYIYKNVGYYSTNKGVKDGRYDVPATLFKGNKGTIYIKDANNIANGDVLGFRVHAVNLDGTLYDPDGRAFYVKFGKQETRHALSFDITVYNNTDSATAVQNPVNDVNPIAAYNEQMDEDGILDHFFNREQYPGSFKPEESYSIEYVWRENNPALRLSDTYPTQAFEPIAGTNDRYKNLVNSNNYTIDKIEDIFDFYYSENANADVENETDGVQNEWTAFNKKYAGDKKVAANRLTQSVRAQINKGYANRLIDGETYKITAFIKRLDAQTGEKIVNIIDIDITKKMPTDLPKAFAVKSAQNINPVTFYVRPYFGKNWLDTGEPWQITWGQGNFSKFWKKNTYANNVELGKAWLTDADEPDGTDEWHNYRWAVDARQYNFEEFFKGLLVDTYDEDGDVNGQTIDKNYYFVFTTSGDIEKANPLLADNDYKSQAEADNGEADSDVLAVFDKDFHGTVDEAPADRLGGYHLPIVSYKHVNGAAHDVLVGYIYREISANLKEDGKRFYNPQTFEIHGDASGMKNQDYKLDPIKFDRNGDKADETCFKAKYACAFDAAVELKDSVWERNGNLKTVVCMTNIAYEDAKLVAVTKAAQGTAYLKLANDSKSITGFDFSNVNDADVKKVVSTDYAIYTVDEKFLTTTTPASKIGYFNAGLNNVKTAKNLLTELLSNQYLIIPDLDPSTIKIDLYSGYDNKTLKPTTATTEYDPADYFTWYYAKEGGEKATKSSEVAGIAFDIYHRTVDLPHLTKDFYGKITFPVVNVWNHNAKGTLTLYVRFQMPKNQAARRSR